MPSFTIPSNQVAGLKAVLSLSPKELDELVKAIDETQPTLFPSEFAKEVSKKVKPPLNERVDLLIRAIVVLYSVRYRSGFSADQFAQILSKSPSEDGKLVFEKSDDQELIAKRLSVLLSLDKSLGIAAKANSVQTANQHVFLGVRILTDVRPIFGIDPEEEPENVALVHTLKIDYFESGSYKEFFVALDDQDIEKLRAALGREIEKSKSLRKKLERNFRCLEAEGED